MAFVLLPISNFVISYDNHYTTLLTHGEEKILPRQNLKESRILATAKTNKKYASMISLDP